MSDQLTDAKSELRVLKNGGRLPSDTALAHGMAAQACATVALVEAVQEMSGHLAGIVIALHQIAGPTGDIYSAEPQPTPRDVPGPGARTTPDGEG